MERAATEPSSSTGAGNRTYSSQYKDTRVLTGPESSQVRSASSEVLLRLEAAELHPGLRPGCARVEVLSWEFS